MSTLPPTPRFRRGVIHPSKITYLPVSIKRCDEAWKGVRGYVRWYPRPIIGRDHIAAVMGVSPPTASRYRRVLAALGLIEDIPGFYDHTDGYDQRPAEIVVFDHPDDAFSRATVGFDRLYVLSQEPEQSPPSPARPPQSPWLGSPFKPSEVYHLLSATEEETEWTPPPEFFSQVLTYKRKKKLLLSTFEKNWLAALPDAAVVVGFRKEPVAQSMLRAKRVVVNGHDPDESFTVRDLEVLYGWSQPTAYRRLGEWLQAQAVAKVGRGRYAWISPPDQDK